MSLKLYYHPLSSFCWKVLIALYENDTAFTPVLLNLQKEEDSATLRGLWPIRKFPVLKDESRDRVLPESTIIIEYLDRSYPGRTKFISDDVDRALETRLRDRFYDLYVHMPMQKVISDRMRPKDQKDAAGVEEAKTRIALCYDIIDRHIAGKSWEIGESFSLADCAAAPALYYANHVLPFGQEHKNLIGYFERLTARPSVARVIKEAGPYFAMVPRE